MGMVWGKFFLKQRIGLDLQQNKEIDVPSTTLA